MNETIYFIHHGRKRKGEKHFCELKSCGKEFIRRTNSTTKQKFCSTQCKYESSKKQVNFICTYCGKKYSRSSSCKKKSKHEVYFCSRKCKDLAQCLINKCLLAAKIRPNHYGISNGKASYAKTCKRIQQIQCVDCNETKEYLLVIHHIDGNRNNNPIDGSNWEIVCRNCHNKRHLKFKNNRWIYDTKFLTPRNKLKFL
jgi:hypothetical protein